MKKTLLICAMATCVTACVEHTNDYMSGRDYLPVYKTEYEYVPVKQYAQPQQYVQPQQYAQPYVVQPAPTCSTCAQPVPTCNTCARPVTTCSTCTQQVTTCETCTQKIQPVLHQEPKTIVVMVPPAPQPVVEHEIVYQPQPSCGCKHCGCNKAAK